MIVQAADADALVTAWHAAPEEQYDFISGAQRIEVKRSLPSDLEHDGVPHSVAHPAGEEYVAAGRNHVCLPEARREIGSRLDEKTTCNRIQ